MNSRSPFIVRDPAHPFSRHDVSGQPSVTPFEQRLAQLQVHTDLLHEFARQAADAYGSWSEDDRADSETRCWFDE